MDGQTRFWSRCLGARLLPEIPEPQTRLFGRMVEHGELGRGSVELRIGPLTAARSCAAAHWRHGPCTGIPLT